MYPWVSRSLFWMLFSVGLSLYTVYRLPSRGALVQAKRLELKSFMAILAEDSRDVRVCERLGLPRETAPPKPGAATDENAYRFDELFGPNRSDSLLEAYRMPLRALLQEPSVAELIREMDGIAATIDPKAENVREDFLAKGRFYARVAKAGGTLVVNRRKFERLGDRATHLGVLAKMGIARPDLRENSSVMDFCRKTQGSAPLAAAQTLREERNRLLSLLSEVGLKPEELGFDPEEWTRFSVQRNGRGLKLGFSRKEPPR